MPTIAAIIITTAPIAASCAQVSRFSRRTGASEIDAHSTPLSRPSLNVGEAISSRRPSGVSAMRVAVAPRRADSTSGALVTSAGNAWRLVGAAIVLPLASSSHAASAWPS